MLTLEQMMMMEEEAEDKAQQQKREEQQTTANVNVVNVKTRESTAKRWCFTSHEAQAPVYQEKYMSALEYQQEICPKTGALHWQGWVQFVDRVRLAPAKLLLGSTKIHIEKMKGSLLQNTRYCTKKYTTVTEQIVRPDGTIIPVGEFETAVPNTHKFFGEKPEEDAQHRWPALKQSIKNVVEGKEEWRDAVEGNFQLMVQYPAGIKAALSELVAPSKPSRPVCNICLWGVAGTGKTKWIYDNWPIKDVYFKSKPQGANDWWDGYQGQTVVVWDDFYGEHKFSEMLNWTDCYYRQAPIKGSHVWIRNTINVFTSNKDPATWWQTLLGDNNNIDLKAAWRRRLPDENQFFIAVEADLNFKFVDKMDQLTWIGGRPNIRARGE